MENKAELLDLMPGVPPAYNCHLNSSDPNSDAPPEYNSHFVPGPPGPAVPPPAYTPGDLPVGYYSPQQLRTLPSYLPTGGTHPIQYQYGWYPSPSKSATATWMPEPVPMLNCPPGLEYLGQVLHTNPNCFLMKYDLGDPTRRNEKLKRVGKG